MAGRSASPSGRVADCGENARNNLAAAYRAAGRRAEAIPLFEQNLAVCERLLGADHPKTLGARNNLALASEDADRAS
jgi:Tetratricopeptide repeat